MIVVTGTKRAGTSIYPDGRRAASSKRDAQPERNSRYHATSGVSARGAASTTLDPVFALAAGRSRQRALLRTEAAFFCALQANRANGEADDAADHQRRAEARGTDARRI